MHTSKGTKSARLVLKDKTIDPARIMYSCANTCVLQAPSKIGVARKQRMHLNSLLSVTSLMEDPNGIPKHRRYFDTRCLPSRAVLSGPVVLNESV